MCEYMYVNVCMNVLVCLSCAYAPTWFLLEAIEQLGESALFFHVLSPGKDSYGQRGVQAF